MSLAAGRPTICLSMIVKDEVDVLGGLLESVRQHIDYWVICDTGSTDGTQELIRRELQGIPGELHERQWVDFGVNRTECMQLSRGKADYLLILDADTTLELPPGALDRLDKDGYMLRHVAGATEYWTMRLVRGSLDWRYEGAIHEYIVSDEARSAGKLEGSSIHNRSVGALRKGRFERDLALLQRAVEEHPEDQRARFYLAQTYRDIGDASGERASLERAREHYRVRAGMGGWPEEAYVAAWQAGMMSLRLDEWPAAVSELIAAWELRPERLEAVCALSAGLRERGQHHGAHAFAQIASALAPLPAPDDVLFLEPWVYAWGMLFEYSITSYWVGDFRQSTAACKRLLAIDGIPEQIREQTRKNLGFAVREAVRESNEEPPAPPPRVIHAAGSNTRRRASP